MHAILFKRPVFLCFLLACFACSTFILENQVYDLKKLEQGNYIMLKEIKHNDHLLAKGEKVKLHLRTNDSSIKVYAYPSSVDFLKANRVLVLQMFSEDFKQHIYVKEVFDKKLNNYVRPEK